MSTGSEAFSLFAKFLSLIKMIYPRLLTKPLSNDAKSPLPVEVGC